MEKAIHPQSRKARQMGRQNAHDSRKTLRKVGRDKAKSPMVYKVQWFKESLDASKEQYTYDQVLDLITVWLQRYDEEIEEKKTNPNRVFLLKGMVEKEKTDFINNGLLVPDLTRLSVIRKLKEWDGDAKSVDSITLAKFKAKGDMLLLGGGSILAVGPNA